VIGVVNDCSAGCNGDSDVRCTKSIHRASSHTDTNCNALHVMTCWKLLAYCYYYYYMFFNKLFH